MSSTSSFTQSAVVERDDLPETEGAVMPLIAAFTQAIRDHCVTGEIAISLDDLRQRGLADPDLESLVLAGLVEKLPGPTTATPSSTRRPGRRDATTAESCVIRLTPSGAALVLPSLSAGKKDEPAVAGVPAEIPVWDEVARELWWRSRLVKRFWRYAANQFLVLSAFQTQGWPLRIDNPLPRTSRVNAKARLRETLKSLQRGQNPVVLRFRADGSGLGVRWETVP
jgi:hypothetical protein